MASKAFLLLGLTFAVFLLITTEVAAAKDLTSNHDSEVEEARYGGDDRGYNNGGGRGGYNNGGGRGGYNNGGGRGGYNNGGGHGGYNNGGHGGYNNGGGSGGGGYGRCCKGCRYGCCGRCKCCHTYAEATAYKQTQN